MKELLIFCDSYPQIENTLYTATHNCQDCSITIAVPSSHPDLFKFFQVINAKLFDDKMNLICYQLYQPRRAKANIVRKILYLLPDIIKERQHLKAIFNTYFAELKRAEVYFSSRCLSPYTFYLLRKLRRTNKLIYIYEPTDIFPVDKYIPANITDLAGLMILKLVYGRDVVMGKLPLVKGFPCVPDRFMAQEVDRVIGREERNEIMKDFDLSKFKKVFDVGKYSIIYFHQDLVQEGYIADKDTFKRELAEIFNHLSKYFPEKEIARKYHPCYPGDKMVVQTGEVIEDFIPGEFLYNDNVRMYLSLFSGAIANVEKGLAVSLADLITFRDDETREQLRKMLLRMSHSEILFPKSLDEFERILIKLCPNKRK